MQLLNVILLWQGLRTFKLLFLISFLKFILVSERTLDDIVFLITFFSFLKKLFLTFISVKLDRFYVLFLLMFFLSFVKANKEALILFNLIL